MKKEDLIAARNLIEKVELFLSKVSKYRNRDGEMWRILDNGTIRYSWDFDCGIAGPYFGHKHFSFEDFKAWLENNK